jgi:hypothetical protein
LVEVDHGATVMPIDFMVRSMSETDLRELKAKTRKRRECFGVRCQMTSLWVCRLVAVAFEAR